MDCGATSIEPFFSHVAYKKLVGGGFMEIVNPEIPNALKKLNYTDEQIKDIMDYILRKETVNENGYSYEKISDGKIEGCPHLKEEHLPIFDTANKCGTGQRYIKPMGHVLMMASLTPMISGAISKTVNLPREATREDISNIFLEAWKLGVKGITVYKDGSKACQPLNSIKDTDGKIDFNDMTYKDLVDTCYDLQNQINKPKRQRAEGIRKGTTHPAEIDGIKIYTTINRRENGEICEIYVTTDREGSTITGLLNSLSKTLSVMLQYHVAPVDIANMLKGQQYEPNGFVNRHPYVKYCDSISDLVSRIIEIEIGDYSRCQVKPTQTENKQEETFIKTNTNQSNVKQETKQEVKPKGQKVYGKTCPECGSTRMRQNGTCYVCEDCGSTTGCS